MRSQELVLAAVQGVSMGGSGARGVCPWCVFGGHRTSKKNLCVRSDGSWNCFRCRRYGQLEGYERLPQEAAIPDIEYMDPPPGFSMLRDGICGSNRFAYDYIKSRGVDKIPDSVIFEAMLGITWEPPNKEEDELDFRKRLIVPVTDTSGRWIGYVGRDTRPKSTLPYLYSRGTHRANMLYNEKALYVETDVPLLVVEGTLDALYLWPHAVAVLGTWGDRQAKMLLNAKRPVVAVLDGDAWRKGHALAIYLQLHDIPSGYVKLGPRLDPDDYPRKQIFELAERSLCL